MPGWLARQPSWSDFPFIVLATRQPGRRSAQAIALLHSLGNVILLERPLNAEIAGQRRRCRRAGARGASTRRASTWKRSGRTRAEVERLNSELEARILDRTRELASANDRLMKEIAERERAQAALTQGQKMEAIGRLTGGIAHDFNNLLHVVNMNLELISLYAKEEKVKPVVERAKSAAKRGAKLTGQLLSFARSQSLLPKLTQVNKLLVGMKDLLEISAGPGVEVELELCEQPAAVVVDPSQLEMAMLNLAVNSREAMPEGGTLKISTCVQRRPKDEAQLKRGDYVVVSVSDTGKGIPAAAAEQGVRSLLHDQAHGQRYRTGPEPGLWICAAVRRPGLHPQRDREGHHGGDVLSRCPGRCAGCGEATGGAGCVRELKSRKILVVEDDADVRRVIVECLGLIGYSVTEAANGTEGLAAIASHKPDLLVVDYAMPDMTGAEVISKAREMVGDLPVILATGYADMAAVERLAGKPAILRKPFDINSLGAAVAFALEGVPEHEGA